MTRHGRMGQQSGPVMERQPRSGTCPRGRAAMEVERRNRIACCKCRVDHRSIARGGDRLGSPSSSSGLMMENQIHLASVTEPPIANMS